MNKILAMLVVIFTFTSISNVNFVYSAKFLPVNGVPLTGIIDIDDRSFSEHYYALQKDGTVWIGTNGEPVSRGPRVNNAVKISGTLILTSNGDVWSWNGINSNEQVRMTELSNIKDISAGPANMALNDSGQVYVWGDVCFVSIMRPDFDNRKEPLCKGLPLKVDSEQAMIPKIALEKVEAINSSSHSVMVLMNDGKTIRKYGNTYLMDMGMSEVDSKWPVTSFVGYDSDAVGNDQVLILPDQGMVANLPKEKFRQFSVSYEGFYHLYLNQDGTVWGSSQGLLQKIKPLKNIIEVSAIALNSGTALDKNGTVWTWGNRNNFPYTGKPEPFLNKIDAKPLKRQLSLKINGEYAQSTPGPIQSKGVTFVPIRALFESIGAKVGYDDDQITISYSNQILKLKVYDTTATLNGKKIQTPVAPTSYQGKTYVPVKFLVEALGGKVTWDANDSSVVVQMNCTPIVRHHLTLEVQFFYD